MHRGDENVEKVRFWLERITRCIAGAYPIFALCSVVFSWLPEDSLPSVYVGIGSFFIWCSHIVPIRWFSNMLGFLGVVGAIFGLYIFCLIYSGCAPRRTWIRKLVFVFLAVDLVLSILNPVYDKDSQFWMASILIDIICGLYFYSSWIMKPEQKSEEPRS